jgi:putative ABC transport system permease protein
MPDWRLDVRARLSSLGLSPMREAEIVDELSQHLDDRYGELIAGGASPEEATRLALADFRSGNVLARHMASLRQAQLPPPITPGARTGHALSDLWRDIGYTSRTLRKQPGFAALAIMTLALGIGATTAVFGVVNGVLIRPLPYPQADRLVAVWQSAEFQGRTVDSVNLSSTMYLTYQEHNQTFQEFGVWRNGMGNVTGLGDLEEVQTLVVTYGTLAALGVRPALGQWFSQADDTPGTPETVVLSYGYWLQRFGGERTVIGRSITIDSRPREVIGVMPQGFRFLSSEPEVILPQRFEEEQLRPNDVHVFTGIARLKPGVSLAQANADVARMLPIWIAEYGTSRQVLEAARFKPALRPLKQDVVGDVGQVLWILTGTIGIVLLIACANVANLVLVRAEGRRQELTVRVALGAGWWRIGRQLLVESLTLGILGGGLGLALAYGGLTLLVAVGPANLPRLAEISIDPWVLAFTSAISLLSGLLFGLVPVVKYIRPRASLGLQGGSRTQSHSRERHRTQNALVMTQVALAIVLLIASGLMLRSFQALRNIQPGFSRPDDVQTMRISIPEAYAAQPERVVRMQAAIVEQIAAIHGVSSVAFATALPMEAEFENNTVISAEGVPDGGGIPPLRRTKFVAPGLFDTLGIPLVAGRDFTWTDIDNTGDVAIVSENMAREMWGGASAALGKRIRVGRVGPWKEIIGVVGDVYDSGVQREAPAIVYWPAGVNRGPLNRDYIPRAVTFAVRSDRTGTDDFLQQVRDAVWAVNPNLPVSRARTLGEVYAQSMSRTSFTLVMLGIAGSMALVLSIIGIYGVVSYAMSQRRREIGIRLALGARVPEVRRLFVRRALIVVGLGAAIGLGGAAGVTRLMQSLLFGTSPLDSITFTAMPVVLAATAVLAGYLSTRRALAVNPVETLKAE